MFLPTHLNMFLPILFIFAFLISSSTSQGDVNDFCVPEIGSSDTPSGFACKNESDVTTEDFVSSILAKPGNTSNVFNSSVIAGSVDAFPGINGLGISMIRLDIEPKGIIPMHTHPGASEILLLIKGRILAGFISSTNRVYMKTLNEGEMMVFPRGLFHFQYNVGNETALAFNALGSSNPRVDVVQFAFFSNDLPSDVVAATTSIDRAEVQRLKAVFGGTDKCSCCFI